MRLLLPIQRSEYWHSTNYPVKRFSRPTFTVWLPDAYGVHKWHFLRVEKTINLMKLCRWHFQVDYPYICIPKPG